MQAAHCANLVDAWLGRLFHHMATCPCAVEDVGQCCARRRSNRTVLLLQRRSKHNDGKWGLPGGNAEEADASLLDTARREAAEEMGDVPDFEVTGVVETRFARLTAARCLRGR